MKQLLEIVPGCSGSMYLCTPSLRRPDDLLWMLRVYLRYRAVSLTVLCIANREYAGMTPLGMTFPELASMTGGGVQTPGFMGHGKHFIASKKFMKAEGGIERIVWMPKDLKEQVKDRLNADSKRAVRH